MISEFKSANILELIANQINEAIIFADDMGVIVYWNVGAEEIFCFQRDEVIGQSLDLIIPNSMRKRHWAGYQQAIESGVTRSKKATLTKAINKSGQSLYVEMNFSIVKNNEGRVIGSVAVARDVTEKYLSGLYR